MNIEKILSERRSIRKFKVDPVDNHLLTNILDKATNTSTSGNMQAYSVIVTRDQKKKEQLFRPHFEQDMILNAPVFLTFCADFHRMRTWLKESNALMNFDNYMSFMISAIDATLYSQSVALLAEGRGLGVCYMGTTLASCDQIGKILELPENVVPVVGFALGWPDEKPNERCRLPLKAITHEETYNTELLNNVNSIYEEKNIEGMSRYKSDDSVENLAQFYTKHKYTKASHIQYSETVLNYLKEQNFLNH